MAYQLAKDGAEIKRDMEKMLLENQKTSAGTSGTARETAGLAAWLKTNTSIGTGAAADPTWTGSKPTSGRTDGTTRPLEEALLKEVIKQCFDEGAKPSMVLLGSAQKQVASANLAGIAAQRYNVEGPKATTIIGAADIYFSDFGNLSIVPDRFIRGSGRDAFVIDLDYASVCYLRPFKTEDIAKTGDAEKKMLIVEYEHKVHTEKAHGIIADLSTAAS